MKRKKRPPEGRIHGITGLISAVIADIPKRVGFWEYWDSDDVVDVIRDFHNVRRSNLHKVYK
jgi:hypothetical protein